MITNAKLISITPPPTPNADGGNVEHDPITCDADVLVDAPTSKQMTEASANKIVGFTSTIYVEIADAATIKVGSRISVRFPEESPLVYEVLHRPEFRLNNLSHVALFCGGL